MSMTENRHRTRVALRYTGDTPVSLPGSVAARPSTVRPGDTVTVDAWAVSPLILGAFEPLETALADLKGKALDDKLEAAGLPTTGRVDDKRARLAEHEAQLAENGETTTDAEGATS